MMDTRTLLEVPLLGSTFPLPVDRPFTPAMARDAGISRFQLARLHEVALVRRLLRGVYVAAQLPDSLPLRQQALELVAPRDGVVVDWTSCWLWTGVLPFGQHVETPPVSFFLPTGRRLRNKLAHSGERTFRAGEVVQLGNLLVAVPLRTAHDLGRLAHRDAAIGGLDALLRHGTFESDELVAGVAQYRGQRGVVQLRSLAPIADRRAESPGESVLRLRWLDMPSLPRPELQIPVPAPDGEELARIDLGVEELRLGVEYDGIDFHTTVEQVAHDRSRRAWLRQAHGWHVRAVDRSNVFGRDRDIEAILQHAVWDARARCGLPRIA